MSWCDSEYKSLNGLVRVDVDDAQRAAKLYIEEIDSQIKDAEEKTEAARERLIEEEIESVKKGWFGKGWFAKEITREEAIKRLKTCRWWMLEAYPHQWLRAKVYGPYYDKRDLANNVLYSAKNAKAKSITLNIDVWGWLAKYIEDEKPPAKTAD